MTALFTLSQFDNFMYGYLEILIDQYEEAISKSPGFMKVRVTK
jgi:hypothetical protein